MSMSRAMNLKEDEFDYLGMLKTGKRTLRINYPLRHHSNGKTVNRLKIRLAI